MLGIRFQFRVPCELEVEPEPELEPTDSQSSYSVPNQISFPTASESKWYRMHAPNLIE